MLRMITRAAFWLDNWLQQTLGRPYNFVLGVGLVSEIVRGVIEFRGHVLSSEQMTGSVAQLVVASALLVHQIGALSHRVENRGEGRRSRRQAE